MDYKIDLKNYPDNNIKISEYKLIMETLSVYRNLLLDETVKNLYLLLTAVTSDSKDLSRFINVYNDFYFSLLKNNSTRPLSDYLLELVLYDENEFSRSSELSDFESIHPLLRNAVKTDLNSLQIIGKISSAFIKKCARESLCNSLVEKSLVENLSSWDFSAEAETCSKTSITSEFRKAVDWSLCTEPLADFYKKQGTGVYSRYKGFVWEPENGSRELRGVEAPDPVTFSDLSGYEFERSIVIKNTLKFLKGHSANNVLLYGDRGTGKSSTVKALLNEYHSSGLRVIEIPKMYLTDFPEIIRLVKGRPQKFIFFIDDLTFEDNEESYTSMKAILEGGLETRPDNVVIYATTNRRHLIKEKFSDRSGLSSGYAADEVHAADTIQEKLSLADRFGITVTFISPDKLQYLSIVEAIAEKRGLKIEKERLHKEALQWEIRYNGRSPRTAHQFIDWLEGELT